ncbi:hypothetical protein [Clostridium sp.]
MQMLQAGLGDILGKYTALADWHIANILNGEYFCTEVEKLILSSLKKCEEAASGGEHYLSHCYEMIFMNSGENTKWLHGNTVGVGVGVAAYAFKFAKDLDIHKIRKRGDYLKLDKNKWEQNITDVFTKSSTNIKQAQFGIRGSSDSLKNFLGKV